jgi:hypothetical protein
MAWRTAGGVLAWHRDLKAAYPAAAPPATPIVSWGTIGDLDHASTSDHAPHDFPGWGNDIVTAGDAPHAPGLGLDMHLVTEAMRRARDSRVKYVIFWRRIFSSYGTSTRAAWSWGPYSNAANDPHTDHAHLSLVGAPAADGTQRWEVGDVSLTPDQQQQLTNIHDWVFDTARGLIAADPGTPHVTTYKPNEWLKALYDRPAAGGPTDEQIEALAERVAALLRPELQGAAEAAVRAVLGELDGATPETP